MSLVIIGFHVISLTIRSAEYLMFKKDKIKKKQFKSNNHFPSVITSAFWYELSSGILDTNSHWMDLYSLFLPLVIIFV